MSDPIDPSVLQRALTDSFHPASYSTIVAASEVSSDISGHRVFERRMPHWRWNLWGHALGKMLVDGCSDFSLVRVFNGDYHRETAPKYKMIQTGLSWQMVAWLSRDRPGSSC